MKERRVIGRCVLCENGYHTLQEGEWCYYLGVWFARPPGFEGIANLRGHSVTEHDDGTITVSPSIKIISNTAGIWHGHLERGVWREA